jgi:hypothetical protein
LNSYFFLQYRSSRSWDWIFRSLRGSSWRHCQAQLPDYRNTKANHRMVPSKWQILYSSSFYSLLLAKTKKILYSTTFYSCGENPFYDVVNGSKDFKRPLTFLNLKLKNKKYLFKNMKTIHIKNYKLNFFFLNNMN